MGEEEEQVKMVAWQIVSSVLSDKHLSIGNLALTSLSFAFDVQQ